MLEGGSGTNRVDGGDGIDTASYAGAAAGVTVSLALPGPGAGDRHLDRYAGGD